MLKRLSFVVVSGIFLMSAFGCGKSGTAPEFPAALGSGTSNAVTDASKFTATISGEVLFDGMPPKLLKIQMSADPYCASHDQGSAETEDVLVNPNGTLSNVMVYVKSGVEGLTFATPTQPVVIDQRGCRYHPHVFTIMVHQPLIIKNSDATLHNIHIWSMINMPFNVGQPVQNMETKTTFDKPEILIPIRCDVQKWMNAFVGAFAHPFHTVTHEEGTFELRVPPGKYEIGARQEKLGEQTQTVEVGDHEKKELVFTFKEAETD